MQRFLLLTIFFCLLIYNAVSQPTPFEQQIKQIKSDPDLRNGIASVYAIDLSTNKKTGELNSDVCLRPASIQKLITTAAALLIFGTNYRFKTELLYDGTIDSKNRILHGNIYIKGYGDPTLGSRYFGDSSSFLDKWIDAVRLLGIDSIDGAIIGDASYFSYDIVPPTWSWEDIGNYFGAGACGISIFDNSYTLYYNTSYQSGGITTITKIEPEIPGLAIENKVRSANISSDKSYIFGAPYTYNRSIKGYLPRGRTNYKVRGSMPDPELFAAQYFTQKLISNKIGVSKQPLCMRILSDSAMWKTSKSVFYTKYSPTLSEIVYQINKKSINFFAENLLVHIGKTIDSVDDTKSSTDAIVSFWGSKGMDTSGISINDGSGLSQYNSISAKQMVWLLEYMNSKAPKEVSEAFFNSLAIAGKDGTLKGVGDGTQIEGRIFAKSGSIRKVRCYAGYANSISGKKIAFTFMLNNYNCSDKKAKSKLENLMLSLINY